MRMSSHLLVRWKWNRGAPCPSPSNRLCVELEWFWGTCSPQRSGSRLRVSRLKFEATPESEYGVDGDGCYKKDLSLSYDG